MLWTFYFCSELVVDKEIQQIVAVASQTCCATEFVRHSSVGKRQKGFVMIIWLIFCRASIHQFVFVTAPMRCKMLNAVLILLCYRTSKTTCCLPDLQRKMQSWVSANNEWKLCRLWFWIGLMQMPFHMSCSLWCTQHHQHTVMDNVCFIF